MSFLKFMINVLFIIVEDRFTIGYTRRNNENEKL